MPSNIRPTVLVALGWVSALMVGCAIAPGDSTPSASSLASESPSVPSRSFAAFPQPTASTGAVGGVPEEMLSEVVADAASRAAVDPSAVNVIVAEAVTWSDGSLGCPEPGMSYTQALVPGYRVVVEAGGEELHFHAGVSGEFRYCDDPRPALEGNAND
ncbi:MAG TPA: hypothetical protein VFT01_11385 [Homoserinimonas sp.]|nr:hypothetical protein [Homoserinimonas sp.]